MRMFNNSKQCYISTKQHWGDTNRQVNLSPICKDMASVLLNQYYGSCDSVCTPEKGWCYSADHCCSLMNDTTVVEDVSRHIVI